MFEGLVRQLLLGYLGRYVKDIQKEQLKITLWNEEVLLENVELILEAFDYLQLPFALKQGRIGRLSIKIPWKKLGWDPIIIVLEDVFIYACQRADQEWSLDSVERRAFSAKKAKLAAAELAKLSRRVCDNQAGQSFISYITAKILDGIQVSIRNVHVMYIDKQSDSVAFIFGLRFSSLTIMNQNPVGSSNVKLRSGQVNKIVEISSLGIYCSTFCGTLNLMGVDDIDDSQLYSNPQFECDKYDYIVAPFDMAVSLMVNRSGKLENGVPQYSINAELADLVMVLNEVQLQQILILWDYLCTCQLREKYGRYRPWSNLLSRKLNGWQRMWWHYAQESVLSDVQRKLKKTSWRYLGQRISYRRKYVRLYKMKLDLLQQEQPLDEETLRELEQMEKESDIDDILSYRSIAERKLQEFLLNSTTPSLGTSGANITVEKQQNDERSSSRSGGWLNWLSRGMLGAGGTDDSSQFSGVVSDEIIKDIYEATKFHPLPSFDGDATTKDGIYLSSIKFNIHQITAMLRSKSHDLEIVEIIFYGVTIECKLLDESATIIAVVNSVEMVYPCTKNVILLSRRSISENNLLKKGKPSICIQVDMSPIIREIELSVKVMLQPFEVTCDSEFLLNLLDFYYLLGSFKFQHKRVLSSLNGFENVKARLLSKAEYIFSSRTKVIWDVSFSNFIINIPWRNEDSEWFNMVLEFGSLLFRSRLELASLASDSEYRHDYLLTNFLSSTSTNNMSLGVQLQDLYDHFEIVFTDFEVKIIGSDCSQAISVCERFGASITLESCFIPDEPMLKQLEVHFIVPSLHVHFSPLIYGAVVGLIACLDSPHSKSEQMIERRLDVANLMSNRRTVSNVFQFSATASLASVICDVNLANDGENSLTLILALGELNIHYALQELMEEYRICMKTLKIDTSTLRGESSSHTLCLSRSIPDDGGSFVLHYQTRRSVGIVCHNYTMSLYDIDLHCYPNIFGLLWGFYDKTSGHDTSCAGKNPFGPIGETKHQMPMPSFGLQKFGFSNFYETGSTTSASIPLDHFPFVTIFNSGSLSCLESSLIYGISEWRRTFHVRDRKTVRSPKFSMSKGSTMFNVPKVKSSSGVDAFPVSGDYNGRDPLFIDLNLNGIRVHFHDSSCILGTVTLPLSKSSVFIHEKDCWDILGSIEGLLLSSSWSTQKFHEFLWGPSLPNLSPILNFRVKKGHAGPLGSQIQISISIQHVCCILTSEFLAMLIGYFSLPDWCSNTNEPCVTVNRKDVATENSYDNIYKFEILDSTLVLPVESDDHHSLQFELQQLYCSFIPMSNSEDAIKDIPLECLVPADEIADRVHLLNVFARDLYLSLMLHKDEGHVSLKLGQDTSHENVSLIGPLDADLWIRIPCESNALFGNSAASTCVMMRVCNCQLVVEDDYFFSGVEAVLNVINQLSSVGRQSECFTSDALQFLQLRRSLKESNDVSSVTFTEVKCCVNSLSIKLYRSRRRHVMSSELVAKVDMQLKCSASLRNEIPLCLDIYCSGLALYSFHSSVMLVRCISGSSISSGLDIHFSKSDQDVNELLVGLHSLDIWLHLSAWSEVVDLLGSYAGRLAKTSIMVASTDNSSSGLTELMKNVTVTLLQNSPQSPNLSSSSPPGNIVQDSVDLDSVDLIVKSDNIGLTFHFPFWINEEAFNESGEAEVRLETPLDFSSDILGERTMFEAKHSKWIAVTLHSRDSKLVISGRFAKFKSIVEKAKGMLETYEDKRVCSWPFFQLFQVNVEAEICDKQQDLVHTTAEVRVKSLDVWLSHQIFYFWRGIKFKIPEAGPSLFSFGNMVFEVHVRKASLLLTDGRRSCNGPLLEILMRDFVLHANIIQNNMEVSIASDLLVNYNNIHKVFWEPFIEPWNFHLSMTRKHEKSALLNTSFITDIHLNSTAQLNLNFTEALIEVVFRVNEIIKDAWGLIGVNDLHESQKFLECQISDNVHAGRYAPYILQNETSLPLLFHVYRGHVNSDGLDILPTKERNVVEPGSSVPIYIDESPEEQIFRYSPARSSDNLSEKKSNGAAHHMISIQLDGTSLPSTPISMDLVGLNYFEVVFSKGSDKIEVNKNEDASKYNRKIDENSITDPNSGFIAPVVFDVSIQRYSKLIRLYSTVILLNATSMPLELRFDIPFGVSPKVLGPINPGQEFPLPLHLAEAGRMRWRPLGNTYLWSEAHQLSNILSQESRLGFLRSFVCYPSHPSSDPFRCCISVQYIGVPSSNGDKKGSTPHINETVRETIENGGQSSHILDKSKKRFIHRVTLMTPFLVKNYLPKAVSLTIESGGVTRTVFLPEVETASVFHIDSTHDLGIVFLIDGFKPSILKVPRAESFTATAKFSGTKFCSSETMTFYSDLSNGPIYVTVEKAMEAFSGARELCISVPFLLYNCTGFPITVADSDDKVKRNGCTIPSCYLIEHEHLPIKDSLSLVLSKQDSYATPPNIDNPRASKKHIISLRENIYLHSQRFMSKRFISTDSSRNFVEHSDNHGLDAQEASLNSLKNRQGTSNQLSLIERGSDLAKNDFRKVKACMYSPHPSSSASEVMVRVSRCLPECLTENIPSPLWSSPFFLVPATGSTSVVVPQPSTNGAFIISVTSSPVPGPFSGRTRAITFQPRYVISNACSKDLCYKQKGTDFIFHLDIGQHSHLHWTDKTRELLVSIRFNKPGWLWSGSFLPDHLGDTQVKMRNYVSGTSNMVRVEVQNADISIRDESIVGSAHGNSGTHLILLSDDNTGFMPYRIDNFSKERLRIYQQKYETFETIVHSYTSCPYAWDEPCYPHRLIVEVPGERVLGSYTLDDVKEYTHVYLPSTSEKPERILFFSIHTEGAIKVLSIIDSSYHLLNDMKDTSFPGFREKKKLDQKKEKILDYSERILVHMSFIGISLINSNPREVLFACAKDTKIDVLQSVDQQKFYFQISSLQIDNQLRNTLYPVILSFDHEYRSNSAGHLKNKDDISKIKNASLMHIASDSSCEPIFYLAAAKWRNKDVSLVSFKYIIIRLAPLRLDLEEKIIVSLFDFIRTVISRLQSEALSCPDSTMPLVYENRSSSPSLPSVVPIGAPWQQIFLLARRQMKIYVEVFDLAPIKLTLSFSSTPWMLRNGGLTSSESVVHFSSTAFQRGLMALADVEGAQIYLRQLNFAHHMASLESFQEILIRHYTRQLLHEMYKVFGSAGVIGNPMGFARNVGLGIKDFLSVPAKGILQSPTGLITGMAQGTTSLLSNTVYAISDATTQFSKAAHKSIVAFTFDDQAVAKMEKQQKGIASHSKGVLNEFLQGLTGLLQSPIKGAEKHGLPGVLSGIALGIAGLVARPAASILEVTGETAQSIRNRSRLHQPQCFRVRLPRPLARDFPLRPYSWEEAIGTSMLLEADYFKLKDEILVMCKALKQAGKFVIITERLVLVVRCSSLVGLGTPEFRGVADPEWIIEAEMSLESVIHADRVEEMVNIVGINSETLLRQHQQKRGGARTKQWSNPTLLPLFHTSMEFACKEEAEDLLQVLLSTTEQSKERGLGVHVLHQSKLR